MKLHLYNMMSSAGFPQIMGMQFFMCWIGLAFLVILGAFAKKWLGEEEMLGFPYNWFGSLLGAVAYIIAVTLTGNYKISFIVGLIGMIGGGFGTGAVIGGTEGE